MYKDVYTHVFSRVAFEKPCVQAPCPRAGPLLGEPLGVGPRHQYFRNSSGSCNVQPSLRPTASVDR